MSRSTEDLAEELDEIARELNLARYLRAANGVKSVSKVAGPVVSVGRVGKSVYDDVENKTTRNTVDTTVSVGAGAGGAAVGAEEGAAIGTILFPETFGLGTVVGSLIGGAVGGGATSRAVSAGQELLEDGLNYNIEVWHCKDCGRDFKVRKYKGEKATACPKCGGKRIEECDKPQCLLQ